MKLEQEGALSCHTSFDIAISSEGPHECHCLVWQKGVIQGGFSYPILGRDIWKPQWVFDVHLREEINNWNQWIHLVKQEVWSKSILSKISMKSEVNKFLRNARAVYNRSYRLVPLLFVQGSIHAWTYWSYPP